ncbi:MAG: thiamine biosynthesis protein ThiI [Candidatus Nanohaloarchaea archaeon]|jgi:thiamine biosynthesis protein ThiI
MDRVVVRFGEIGSKSAQVRGQMLNVLRQRVEDRLEYEELEYGSVSRISSRILVETREAEKAAEIVSQVPGVSSSSPAYETEPSMKSIQSAVKKLEVGNSFGIDASRAGEHDFDSMDLNREIGSFVDDRCGAEVDLDDPETWIKIDVREDRAFVYTQFFEGPDGFPTGSQGEMAAMVSGGIDSPVATYEIMTRGADITPVYFYNRPIAAEDHLMRFKSVLDEIRKFHPGKKWHYYVVDMEEINNELMEIGQGRMILHRRLMFRITERIAEKEGLKGIVTGESLGQKSSQTAVNLKRTTEAVDLPVHRPLLTRSKSEVTEKAREIGTMKQSNIKSACTTLSPENPATELKEDQLEELESRFDIEKMVDSAVENAEKNLL